MDLLKTLELADPGLDIDDDEYTTAVWEKAELLCSTAEIDFSDFRRQTADFHDEHGHRTSEQKR